MNSPTTFDRRVLLAAIGSGAAAGLMPRADQRMLAADEPNRAMPPDMPRDAATHRADIGSLFPVLDQLAGRAESTHSFLSGRFRSLDEFQAAGRATVHEAFRYRPPVVDPKPEILDRRDCGEFVREKLAFSTSSDFRVPAYVHIPKGLRGPAPAIVDLHSHGGMFLFGKEKVIDFGANHAVMTRYHAGNYEGRPTTTALVRRGYVVITIDAFMFGERRLMMDEDSKYGWDRSRYSLEDAEYLNRKCRSKESTLAKSLVLAGATWPGIVTWDDMRTVDYLATRPEVDARRIGCVGVSFGGWRTLFLAGLDERIAAACVVGFMSTVKPMLQRHIDTHSWVHFLPGLHPFLDLPDVVSMMAPKPLMVQQCRRDGLFPLEGMQDSVAKIAAVYERAGARDRFDGRFFDVPHRFDVSMQDAAFDWLDQHLKG